MTETKHHYPQLVSETYDFCGMFPNLTFQQVSEFFTSNYDNVSSMDKTKFNNSLRLGWFKFNDYKNNLDYTTSA